MKEQGIIQWAGDLFDAPIDEEDCQIGCLIEEHRGKESAISVPELAALSGIDERRVRGIVRELIERHGYAIGSSTQSPAGYYMITDQDEIKENYRKLRGRGLSILRRAACLRKIGLKELLSQIQTEIELTSES